MTFYSSDVITISGVFQNTAAADTDPTDLSLVIDPHPSGASTTVLYNPGDIVRDTQGHFHYNWTAPSVTRQTMYLVQWQPVGAVQRASDPDRIYVLPLVA